jgi:hypothetical protein
LPMAGSGRGKERKRRTAQTKKEDGRGWARGSHHGERLYHDGCHESSQNGARLTTTKIYFCKLCTILC